MLTVTMTHETQSDILKIALFLFLMESLYQYINLFSCNYLLGFILSGIFTLQKL